MAEFEIGASHLSVAGSDREGNVISPWQLMGTGSEANHNVIDQNLKVVSAICNIFTIGTCCYLVYCLSLHIRLSKSNSQKRKIPLLKWSMTFIMCFFVNTILLVFVPFFPNMYPTNDFFMQLVILVCVLAFFKHWEVNLDLYISNRFVLMLKTKSGSNRLTYMARVMNLASK